MLTADKNFFHSIEHEQIAPCVGVHVTLGVTETSRTADRLHTISHGQFTLSCAVFIHGNAYYVILKPDE